jgi:uncharacterized protein (DUF736 family)
MARIDWKEEKPSGGSNESMSAGVYHVEVADAEERVSQSGDAYFSIRLKDLESGRIVCFDIIMLAGKKGWLWTSSGLDPPQAILQRMNILLMPPK